MRSILILALKDLLLLWRDKFGLFWVAVFPLLYAIFFGSIFSSNDEGSRAISVAIADQDSTANSAEFIAEIEKSDVLKPILLDFEEAKDRVRRGKVTAYILIEKGFGEFGGMFFMGSPPVKIGVDPSRKAEAGYLQGMVTKLLFKMTQKEMSDTDKMVSRMRDAEVDIAGDTSLTDGQRSTLQNLFSSLGQFYGQAGTSKLNLQDAKMGEIEVESVERETIGSAPRSYYDISFPQAIIWGLIGCAASFAISIVTERTKGTLLRLRLAPISGVQILAGKGVACFFACSAVVLLLLAFGKLVFGVTISNPVNLALATFGAAFCFVGIMMFMSVLGKTERAVAGSGWSILMVMAMTGGGMVPAMFMPGWMKAISQFSPVRWAIYGLEGAIWRGFSFSEMMQPFGILLGIGVLFFAVGAIVMSRSEM
ncbi:MAG: ABC transporter permease [Candidatus Zixiibacteriota bacterium]